MWKPTYIIKIGMTPHRYTRTGDDAMTTFRVAKDVKSIVFVTVVVEPLCTHIVHVYDDNSFNNFNCILWTYIMYIYSLICFKNQL
jgi:hypothetical protein